MGARPGGVDVVVTDPERGDDLEPGKSLHKGTIDPLLGGRHRHAAHARRALGEESVAILGVGEFDEVEGAGEPVHDDGLGGTDQENIGFFGGHNSLLVYFPIVYRTLGDSSGGKLFWCRETSEQPCVTILPRMQGDLLIESRVDDVSSLIRKRLKWKNTNQDEISRPKAPQARAEFSADAETMTQPKADCEKLMNWLLPFARQMLERHGEFFPFGGALRPNGEVVPVASYDGSNHPLSADLIRLIKDGFVEAARRSEYKATALVYDVKV